MLAGQVAPLALAAAPRAARSASAAEKPAAPQSAAPEALAARPAPAPLVGPTPELEVTKLDSWDDSATPDLKAEPGQIITYTVTIKNKGPVDATNVQFTDNVDVNTSLNTSSVQTQPVAVADAYAVLGNVRILVTDPAQGLLANDRDPDTGNNVPLTASGPTTTTQGGNITINSDGTFTYNPPPGFEGTGASADTVTYTIRDKGPDNIAGNADDKTDTAVASFNVSGMIWFINSAVSNGDGRLTSPFNCLRGPGCFDSTTTGGAADQANDNIFLYSGSYTGGLTLLSGQKLVGSGASATLATVTGVTVPANSDTLPATNGNPANVTITTSAATTNGVNLPATGATTLRGFTIGNTTAFDIASGGTFGTLNASEVVLNGTGGTLNLNTGALNATFSGVSTTSSGGHGLALNAVSGTLNTGVTSIAGIPAASSDIDIQNLVAGATMTFGATTVNKTTAGAGALVNMATNAGAITFASLTGSNTGGNGVVGTNNTGALTVTSGTGSITSTGGAALSLNNSSGNQAIDLDFSALTTTDSATNAVLLKNVGGTGLSVPGATTFDMNTGSVEGIKIQNSTATTIRIATNGTTNNALAVNDRRSTGILIDAASGTIQFGTTTIPNTNAAGGYGISVQNSSAAVTFPSATISDANIVTAQTDAGDGTPSNDGDGDAIFLKNNAGGSFTLNGGTLSNCGNDCIDARTSSGITISGVTITNQGVDVSLSGLGLGGNGIQAINLTGTNSITGTTIQNNATTGHTGLHFYNTSGNTVTMTVQGTTFQNFTGNGTVGAIVSTTGTGTTNFTVGGATNNAATNCTFSNIDGSAINFATGNTATLNATVQRSTFQSAGADDKTNLTGGNSSGSHVSYNILNNTFNGIMLTASTGEGALSFSADGTKVGNTFAMNMTGNTISNIGSTATSCSNGTVVCLGPLFTILIFIDNTSNVPGTIVVANNIVTNTQQGGLLLDLHNTNTPTAVGEDSNAAGSGVAAKITTNTFGTNAARVGSNPGATAHFGIRVERRANGGPQANVLISGNTVRNGPGSGSTLNGPSIHARTKANDTMHVTITGNDLENSSAGVSELRLETNANDAGDIVSPTMCVDVTGNTVAAGGGTIELRETNGVLNVEQANAGAVATANGIPAGNVSVTGSPGFGTTCATPPAAPVSFDTATVGVMLGAPIATRTDSASKSAFGGGVTDRPFLSLPRAAKTAPKTATLVAPKTATPKADAQSARGSRPDATADAGGATDATGASVSSTMQKPAVLIADPVGPKGSGGTVSVNIGDLVVNDSVTITFQVQVDNPYSGPPQVSNQGTATADGGVSVKTDDTTVGGSADPTQTPIRSTNISINDAKVAEPTSPNTTEMVFTVALASPATGAVSVNFQTSDGTANFGTCGNPGADYVNTSGVVNFATGDQVKTINVSICSDSDAESDETLTVTLSGATGGVIIDNQATGTITTGTPGTFIISELRTSGPDPGGATNDFVELYNNTDSALIVPAGGYGVFAMGANCDATPVLIGTVPAATNIPARGHYLLGGATYSLANYGSPIATNEAAKDASFTSDLPNDGNVAVFSTTDITKITSVNRLDAVGFGTNLGSVCALLREGSNLGTTAGSTKDHTFFRTECAFVAGIGCTVPGNPKDTNDNASDFLFASTDGVAVGTAGQRLGAPGPENRTGPVRRDSSISISLLDGSQPAANLPNRDRDFTVSDVNLTPNGNLYIRRRVTNNSPTVSVTRLRFRIVEVTTHPSSGEADLRALTTGSTPSVSIINDSATCGGPSSCTITVQGTTLETPPSQTAGGGYNSTIAVTLGSPLAPGASINLQFRLGIVQGGKFRFYIITEALP